MSADLNLELIAALGPAWNIAKSVLGIALLILVHELGHFLAGRWSGVRAEVFSIGFGRALLKWKPGPTEYRLAWLPLGGYVKFLDEYSYEGGAAEPDSFPSATYGRKFVILIAGVTMNVIAALVLYMAAFSIGVDRPAPQVGRVLPGSAAWEHDVRARDELVSVDGHEVTDFLDFHRRVMLADEVEIVLRRGGELLPPLRIEPHVGEGGLRVLGIAQPMELEVPEDSRAWENGLRSGDEVIAVNGESVDSLQDAVGRFAGDGEKLVWTVRRDAHTLDVEVPLDEEPVWRIGIERDVARIDGVRRNGPDGPLAAWGAGSRPGDVPVSVGARPTPSLRALQVALRDATATGDLTLTRGAESVEIALPAEPSARAALADDIDAGAAGGKFVSPTPGGPMAAAGMLPGSRLLRIGEQRIEDFTEVLGLVVEAGRTGKPLALTWRQPDGTELGPVDVLPGRHAAVHGLFLKPILVEVRASGISDSIRRGLAHTQRSVLDIFGVLGSLVSAEVSPKALSGPLRIATEAYDRAERGWGDFYLFLGVISMNLAVLNILPIPLLDGGQIMVITAEKVRGEPLPDAIKEGITWTGLVFLIGLMVFVIANDFVQLGS